MTAADLDLGPSARPPRRWSGGLLLRWLVVLVLVGGTAAALRASWSRLGEVAWQFEPWAVAASFGLMVLASTWAAVAWLVVTRAFGASLAIRPALRIYSTSNLGKYLPGKVLHAVARVYLAQQQGVPLPVASAGVAVDVILYVAAALLIVALTAPTVIGSIAELDPMPVTSMAVVGLIVGLALLHPGVLNPAFRLAGRLMPSRQLPEVTVGYGTILRAFALYVVLWGLYTLAVFASALAVHPIGLTSLPLLGTAVALSYLVGTAVAVVPVGLGIRESVLTLLLSQIMPAPAALAVSVLVRLVQILAEAFCAALYSRL